MTQHTPTLWKVTIYKDKTYIDHNHELSEDYWTIAQAFGPQQQANAEFIVRACNSHDVLLAALKDAAHVLEPLVQSSEYHSYGYAYDKIIAAIAQATGREVPA